MKIKKIMTGIFTSVLVMTAAAVTGAAGLNVNAYNSEEVLNFDSIQNDGIIYREVDADADGTYDFIIVSGFEEGLVSAEIPSEINGLEVKRIYYTAFKDCETLKNIIIPDTVEEIESSAFAGCVNLESVVIPDSVNYIGYSAFADCSSLADVVIPQTLTDIHGMAFRNSKWLLEKQKQDPMVIVNSLLIDASKCTGDVVIPEGIHVGEYAFFDSYDVTSITLPDTETDIGRGAFMNCMGLESVILSDKVRSIGLEAFAHCENLKNINIPDSVAEIEAYAFLKCESLTNIELPELITEIYYYTFSDCVKLESIKLPDNLTAIGEGAFLDCASLKNITIPDTVERIDSRAFMNCKSLKSIKIPKNVAVLEDRLLNGCKNLKTLIIMNPEIETESIWETIDIAEDGTIYGYTGTIAELFAQAHKCNFAAIDNGMPEITEPSVTEPPASSNTETTTTVKPCVNVEVARCPKKLKYKTYEELELDGLRVNVFVGSEKVKRHVIPMDYPDEFYIDTKKFDNTKPGTYRIFIYNINDNIVDSPFYNLAGDFEVTVEEPKTTKPVTTDGSSASATTTTTAVTTDKPVTSTAISSSSTAVVPDLPQTGNNSANDIAIAITAVIIVISGVIAVRKSGVVFRKK